ncbi:MAG: DUF3990 domain-containing protein [Erysipelotrichaceae bacterium]|nr:DUF3990 domain-containing protein [Erysipelotrichaceae bacterium]
MNNNYLINGDIKLILDYINISKKQLAEKLDVDKVTLERWISSAVNIDDVNIEKIYSFAFKNDILINEIKSQLYLENIQDDYHKILFHGAKSGLNGKIDIKRSRKNNDFGQGFYCGESYDQAALFVSGFENSCIYTINLDTSNLSCVRFYVNQEWMLAIAYFRGKLTKYKNNDLVQSLLKKLEYVDYVIAPITDNRMYQIIDSFINGEITDEQCKHCLAATNLGYQYVFKTQKALDQIQILEKMYYSNAEKNKYQSKRMGDNKISESKIKIARIQYRGQGQYIDEIL